MNLLESLHASISSLNLNQECPSKIDCATSSGISDTLELLYNRNIHVLDLDAHIRKSPALFEQSNVALFLIWNIKELIQADGGELKRPIVAFWKIQNTEFPEPSNSETPDNSAWHNLVILPKNHALINGCSLGNELELIFSIDLSGKKLRLPTILKYLLKREIQYWNNFEKCTLGGFFPNSDIHDECDIKMYENFCESGIWCLFNTIMLISNGNIAFAENFREYDPTKSRKLGAILQNYGVDLCKNPNNIICEDYLEKNWIYDFTIAVYEGLLNEVLEWEKLRNSKDIDLECLNINQLCTLNMFKKSNSWELAIQFIKNCGNAENEIRIKTPTSHKKIKRRVKSPKIHQSALKIKGEYEYKFSRSTIDLKGLVDRKNIFIDKTLFIKEILNDGSEAIMFTRPRRWGKTFNMHMLKTFLHPDQNADGSFKNLYVFTGGHDNVDLENLDETRCLNIMTVDNGKYREYAGTIPTIFLTFSHISEPTKHEKSEFDYYLRGIKNAIHSAYWSCKEIYCQYLLRLVRNYYTYILRTECDIEIPDKLVLESKVIELELALPFWLVQFTRFINHPDEIDLNNALIYLVTLFIEFYGTKPYVLIDEYDGPINKVINIEVKREILICMRAIFQPVIKDGIAKKVILTGIYEIGKTDMLSGLNSLISYTIQNDTNYANCFGFTESEVSDLLDNILFAETEEDLIEQKELIKEWYNGYNIGIHKIYNPWSIMNCLGAAAQKSQNPLQPYWINSGGFNQLILLFDKVENYDKLFELMNTGYLIFEEEIENQIELNYNENDSDYNKSNTFDDFLAILLHAGYLTKASADKANPNSYRYIIPNKEVKKSFYTSLLTSWMKKKMSQNKIDKSKPIEFIQFLEDGKSLQNLFQEKVLDKMNDFTDKTEEDFKLLIGSIFRIALLEMKCPTYKMHAESANVHEKKLDHIFLPIKNESSTVIIHEYKKLDSASHEQAQERVDDALWQIYAKKYMEIGLNLYDDIHHKHFKNFIIRGIVFYKLGLGDVWSILIKEHKITVDMAKKLNYLFSSQDGGVLPNHSLLSGENSNREAKINARGTLCSSLDSLIENMQRLDFFNHLNYKKAEEIENCKRQRNPDPNEIGHENKRKR
ncbi:unnamed protein product [Blepharisma stoltei]|uniref:AAA-ATPase-like domain-containing protein n=1 Tax=Blepharisma stoltei TaxID=1481888 RepID=A0AAU9K697_9CILI|nr:unnamed protein product [Blepharisma stoltei]